MISFSRFTATSRLTAPPGAARGTGARCEVERLPRPGMMLGDEVLVLLQVGDLFDQRPVFARHQVVLRDLAIEERVAAVDLRDRLLDGLRRAAVLSGEPSDGAPARQIVPGVPDSLLVPGAAVEPIHDRPAPDAGLGRDDERRAALGGVHPDVVDLQQPRGSLRRLGRRLGDPRLLPRAGRELRPQRPTARAAPVAGDLAPSLALDQSQVGIGPVRTTAAPPGSAGVRVGQIVPGRVGQIALVVHQDPGRLLQLAPAGAFLPSRRLERGGRTGGGPVRTAAPGLVVQQAARRAAHPERKAAGRDPAEHRPVPLRRDGRRAQHLPDAQRPAHLVHVADLPPAGIDSRRVPPADVRHDHQAVRTAHDGAHRAVAQEVREPDGDEFITHGASASPCSRRSAWNAASATGRNALRHGHRAAYRRSSRGPAPRS